ncbi:hypothetical protein [Streptomyces sp. NPDC058989]|uniref:hypothetical protein n=1 Tax=Streptomyces sp. NPDC058989 TaxID=3346686 RepID=UPI0036AC01AA
MSNGGIEHEIKGCPACDAETHQKAVNERENQQREDRALPAGLVVAVTFICLVIIGLWAGVAVFLSNVG